MLMERAYIFDLDDTLYCEHDYVRSGFYAVANAICEQYSNLQVTTIYNECLRVWKAHGRGKVFDIVCDKYEIDMDIKSLVQLYREHVPDITLYPDAVEVLTVLQNKGVLTGLITDGNSTMQWRKIKALDVEKYMDVVVVTGDLGEEYWKPSPVSYIKVAQALNVPLESCVYIGDNPHKDFVTAKKLGMKTLRIVRPVGDHMRTKLHAEYEANQRISTLTDIFA